MSSKRMRGRGGGRGGGRKNVNFKTQVFDSNGPDVRVRGTANQVYDKYVALARDAASNGDYIAAEGYYQHAEHYHRLLLGINGTGRPRGDQRGAPEPSEMPTGAPAGGDGADSSAEAAHERGNGAAAPAGEADTAMDAEAAAERRDVAPEPTEPGETPYS